jgi:dihydroorotase
MAILIKQATIIDENSGFSGKKMDILIENGKIAGIKKQLPIKSGIKVIEADDLNVSIGWFDMQSAFCEPNLEHKETIESGSKAAAAGGFTGVCVHGYGPAAINSKTTVEYILHKADKLVNIYPFGNITVKTEGKEMAEMYDMKQAGALAFSDYKNPLMHAGLILRALQYTDNIQSVLLAHCNDTQISGGGQMNEGVISTRLGLKGMPSLAEELMLERNISLLEYTGGKLHISTVSSAGSVDLLKKAKAAGLNITAGVAAANLYLDENSLEQFDTNLKLDPPLRTKKDVEALRKGIESGVIDVIVSDHCPQDTESKELEFDLAEYGIIGLQTAFSCVCEAFKNKPIDAAIKAMTINPRKILDLPVPALKEGETANLTLFSLKQQTVLTEKNNYSKSANSPFFHKTLSGKVIGIINGGKSFFN